LNTSIVSEARLSSFRNDAASAKALGFFARCLAICMTLLACPIVSEAISATVLVASVSGEVKVLSLDDEFEVTLGKEFLGREISLKSVVTTGPGSTAALLFSNGVLVNLQPESRLYVRKFVQSEFSAEDIDLTDLEKEPSTSQLEFHLDFGNLVVKAPSLSKGSSMRLTSPLGTAGIRGTIFQMLVARNPDTGAISGGVNLLSGELEFTDLSGEVNVLASGEGMQISSNRLGVQATAAAVGEITDLFSLYVASSPVWRRDVSLPGEEPLIVDEGSEVEERPTPRAPMSIQEIAAMILFSLEEAEDAVSKFTLDMLENPQSVGDPVSTLQSPRVPAIASSSSGDLFVDQAPTLTLLGDSTFNLDLGEVFADPGFSAEDFSGNQLSTAVKLTGEVNVNVAGTYPLTYAVTDVRGFKTSATRIVVVGDFTSPIVNLNPNVSSFHEAGTQYLDPMATAADVLAGISTDLTASITVNYNFNEKSPPGIYSVIYVATDAAGNVGTATRTVEIQDNTYPVITLVNPFLGGVGFDPMFIDIDTAAAYSDPGATAIDSFDGDLTESIVVLDGAQTGLNQGTVGEFSLEYKVADAAGNITKAYRYVTIIGNDTTGPEIRLAGKDSKTDKTQDPDPYNDEWQLSAVNVATLEVGASWNEYGYKAFKKQGNKIFDYTDEVLVSGLINTAKLDTYTLTYTVKDEYTNKTTATRVVTVVDTTPPNLTLHDLSGSYDLTIEAGDPYVDPGATGFDLYDQTDVDMLTTVYYQGVAVGNDPNTIIATPKIVQHPIFYTVEYNATDQTGNLATNSRLVTVTDLTKPVISLIGDNPWVILQFDYADSAAVGLAESGATATDNSGETFSTGASNITSDVSNVNPQVAGSYVITYSGATDLSGNTADSVTRTVNVLDREKPMFKKNGIIVTSNDTIAVEIGNTGYVHSNYGELTGYDLVDTNVTALSSQIRVTIEKADNPANLAGTSWSPVSGANNIVQSQVDTEINEEFGNAAMRADNQIDDAAKAGPFGFKLTYQLSDSEANQADPVHQILSFSDTLAPTAIYNESMSSDQYTAGGTNPTPFNKTASLLNLTLYERNPINNATVSDAATWLVSIWIETDENPVRILGLGTGDLFYDNNGSGAEVDVETLATSVSTYHSVNYHFEDKAGNDLFFQRKLYIEDRTTPTIYLYGSANVYDFFRFGTNAGVPTTTENELYPPPYNEVNATTNPGSSAVSFAAGEHRKLLADYDYRDAGAYAVDNFSWRSQATKGSTWRSNAADTLPQYPPSSDATHGVLAKVVDVAEGSYPGPSSAYITRVFRQAQYTAKQLQDTLVGEGGNAGDQKLPKNTFGFFDALTTPTDLNSTATLGDFRVKVFYIDYFVKDENDNIAATMTRTVYFYESFQYSDEAFYATPLNDVTFAALTDKYSELDSKRWDSDGDGLSNFWEVKAGTDPKSSHTGGNDDDDLTRFKRWVEDPSHGNKTPTDPYQ
jgi:hypothetical protein